MCIRDRGGTLNIAKLPPHKANLQGVTDVLALEARELGVTIQLNTEATPETCLLSTSLSLRNGDYVLDGTGGLRRAEGREALLERVLFRLTARRVTFPFLPELGSRLWQLGQLSAAQRQSAAEQYVAEALAPEEGLTVDQVTLAESGGGRARVTASMTWRGDSLSVTVEVS